MSGRCCQSSNRTAPHTHKHVCANECKMSVCVWATLALNDARLLRLAPPLTHSLIWLINSKLCTSPSPSFATSQRRSCRRRSLSWHPRCAAFGHLSEIVHTISRALQALLPNITHTLHIHIHAVHTFWINNYVACRGVMGDGNVNECLLCAHRRDDVLQHDRRRRSQRGA